MSRQLPVLDQAQKVVFGNSNNSASNFRAPIAFDEQIGLPEPNQAQMAFYSNKIVQKLEQINHIINAIKETYQKKATLDSLEKAERKKKQSLGKTR